MSTSANPSVSVNRTEHAIVRQRAREQRSQVRRCTADRMRPRSITTGSLANVPGMAPSRGARQSHIPMKNELARDMRAIGRVKPPRGITRWCLLDMPAGTLVWPAPFGPVWL